MQILSFDEVKGICYIRFMRILFLFLIPSILWAKPSLDNIQRLERISFGSCNKGFYKQQLWPSIIEDSPQLFIWGGDIIYGDRGDNKYNHKFKFDRLRNFPGYKILRESVPVIGTWDDHDFGDNNGDGSYEGKYKNQQLLLDFLDEPINSKRRTQEGVYTSYIIGTKGQQVKVILLDNRFHMSKYKQVLGETQWNWLEHELKTSTAQINIIVSGLPILAPTLIRSEEWGDFPKEKKRLLDLFNKYEPKGLLFLSGDKHFGSILEKEGRVEVMSSGLTHHTPRILNPLLRRYYPTSYFGLNYAHLKIDWDQSPIRLEVNIKGLEGKIGLKKVFRLIENRFR